MHRQKMTPENSAWFFVMGVAFTISVLIIMTFAIEIWEICQRCCRCNTRANNNHFCCGCTISSYASVNGVSYSVINGVPYINGRRAYTDNDINVGHICRWKVLYVLCYCCFVKTRRTKSTRIYGKQLTLIAPNGSVVTSQSDLELDGDVSDVTIHSPEPIRTVDSVAATVYVSNGVSGSVSTTSGDIHVEKGDVGGGARSVSGDITISGNVDGFAATVSGNIDADAIFGSCYSVSGDIRSRKR
jgi:hypothetical protein